MYNPQIRAIRVLEYTSSLNSDRAEIWFLFERLEENRAAEKPNGPKTPSGPKVPSSPGVLSSLKLECFEHFRICLFTG